MQRLWFKAKRYGWGWTPATWEGWLVLLGYILAVAAAVILLLLTRRGTAAVVGYAAIMICATAILIAICFKTGEKPRWRWGK